MHILWRRSTLATHFSLFIAASPTHSQNMSVIITVSFYVISLLICRQNNKIWVKLAIYSFTVYIYLYIASSIVF